MSILENSINDIQKNVNTLRLMDFFNTDDAKDDENVDLSDFNAPTMGLAK